MDTSVTALKLEHNGHVLELTAEQHEKALKVGLSLDLLQQLLKQFGPLVAQIIIAILTKQPLPPLTAEDHKKFAAAPSAGLDLTVLRTMLAAMLVTYKAQIVAQADSWVSTGIDELIALIKGPTPAV